MCRNLSEGNKRPDQTSLTFCNFHNRLKHDRLNCINHVKIFSFCLRNDVSCVFLRQSKEQLSRKKMSVFNTSECEIRHCRRP
jgi:hypothetical protein